METATFGGGCFWCTEAVFKRLRGVKEVVSGYSGGNRPAGGKKPSYEQVSTGITGHAEAVQITFDPSVISFSKLLDVFFATHDPTTMNQQGADIGTQYRSVIFYHTSGQHQEAIATIKELEEKQVFTNKIVTQLLPFQTFYTAEEYHQNYFDTNPLQPYCQIVITPKIRKLLEKYGNDVKDEYKA